MTPEPAHIWTDDDTADGCLRQAAFHGGMARCLIRILQQHAGRRASFNEAAAVDQVSMMARSAFQWAAAYLALSENAEQGYQQAQDGSR